MTDEEMLQKLAEGWQVIKIEPAADPEANTLYVNVWLQPPPQYIIRFTANRDGTVN